jgi:hypothetical protein
MSFLKAQKKQLKSINRLQEIFYVKQKKKNSHTQSFYKKKGHKNNYNRAFLHTLMLAEYIQKLK